MRRAVSKILPTAKFLSGDPSTDTPNSNNHTSHLSSLTSNLKIDFNSVAEFYISLDNPHKPWLPGDEVSGQIILISKKNLANIVVTLSLIGFVKINASSHSKLRPIKHNLFNHTIKIYGDAPQPNSSHAENEFANGLFKGEHRFPFIVKLPNKRIFTSIDFGKGSIKYVLRASIGNSSSYTASTPSPTSNYNSSSTHSSPNDGHSPSSTGAPSVSSAVPAPGSHVFAKSKNLKVLHNPSNTAEKVINLISPINVSTLPPPKPKRLIIRDPRGSGNRRLSRTQSATSTINTINSYSTMSSNNSEEMPPVTSAGPSTVTNGSSGSNHLHPSITRNNSNNPASSSPGSQLPISPDVSKSENIKVSLEIPQRGYLRGELIPLKISINHLRKVQDLNGIIVTFVRVCRLDNGPEGLFESFRKDLQQSVIPLYVDPVTFKSEINSSVRVPADAFPTIVGCPLVSFQYFVEVLVNLSGKSLGLENDEHHHSPHHSVPHPSSTFHETGELGMAAESAGNGSDSLKFNFNFNASSMSSIHHQNERSGYINTDKYKRSKKFLQLTTEIIIGTHRGEPESAPQSTRDTPVSQQSANPASTGTQSTNPILNNSETVISRSSSISGSNGSPANFNQASPSPNVQNQVHSPDTTEAMRGMVPSTSSSIQPGTGSSANYIGAIPESSEMNNFHIPPYAEHPQDHMNGTPLPTNFNTIPNYDELAYLNSNNHQLPPPPPSAATVSEKERMRLHESSLLPSAPPEFDNGEDAISPVNDDMLQSPLHPDEAESSNEEPSSVSANQSQTSPGIPPSSSIPNQNEHHQFQFFTFQGPLNTISEADHLQEPANESEDDLYQDPTTTATSREDHDQIDYVPNYESANNDKLLVQGDNISTGTDRDIETDQQ